jgi:hypothetical protein
MRLKQSEANNVKVFKRKIELLRYRNEIDKK